MRAGGVLSGGRKPEPADGERKEPDLGVWRPGQEQTTCRGRPGRGAPGERGEGLPGALEGGGESREGWCLRQGTGCTASGSLPGHGPVQAGGDGEEEAGGPFRGAGLAALGGFHRWGWGVLEGREGNEEAWLVARKKT